MPGSCISDGSRSTAVGYRELIANCLKVCVRVIVDEEAFEEKAVLKQSGVN